jgi:hypothetical protein
VTYSTEPFRTGGFFFLSFIQPAGLNFALYSHYPLLMFPNLLHFPDKNTDQIMRAFFAADSKLPYGLVTRYCLP